MNNCLDDSSPFLIKPDGSSISFNLGDTECTFMDERNLRNESLSFFLPGKAAGEILCTFSALFDGSLQLSKESNAAPEIFVNGSRIPAATNICIQSGDSIVIGSIEHSFIADLNDADIESEEKRTIKSKQEIMSEILTHGDLNGSFKDDETDEVLVIDSNLLVTTSGLVSFLFQRHEIVEWLLWLDFFVDDSAFMNRKNHVLILKLAISMNMKHQKRFENNHKGNVRTYLRGLQFDALLSQDFLIKERPTDSDGLNDILETLKNFCQDINGIAKSLILSKLESSRKHDIPKSVLSEFSNNVFVPVYKIFSLDPEEDNEMSVKESDMDCKAIKDNVNIEIENKLKDEEIQHNPSDSKSNKSDANSDGIDLQHKKQIFLTNILCGAFRKNFEIFEKIDLCKKIGENEIEKVREKEKEKEERLCSWITGCCSLLCVICRYCSTDTTQQISGKDLTSIILPIWTSSYCANDVDDLFETVSITIHSIILLSIRNILRTDFSKGSNVQNLKKVVNNDIPLPMKNNFNFFQTLSLSVESLIPVPDENNVECLAFLEDLKCFLRWNN